MSIRAVVVDRRGERAAGAVAEVGDPLPGAGESVLEVSHSSLNYKDAMAVAGRPGVLRSLPMVAGIDAAGWGPDGAPTIVTGAGLGERRDGGLAERVVVDPSSVVPIPEDFSPLHAAAIGTAGMTAALSVLALRRLDPPSGPVLVTGAGGGVGGFAVALLAAMGYEVLASSGRAETLGGHLRSLGAAQVVGRMDTQPGPPLQRQRWSAVVDAVGGGGLVNAIAQTAAGGVVTACGLAGAPDLPGTVHPFILRGVSLVGIDSVGISPANRRAAWALIEAHLAPATVETLIEKVVGLAEVPQAAEEVLAGSVRGRIVVDVRR